MFETTRRDGVVQAHRAGARWLSTAWNGGYHEVDAAYNLTVPSGFDRTDLTAYQRERLDAAGFPLGPTLLTGVRMEHARCARSGPVTVLATAGLSNPATLPMDGDEPTEERPTDRAADADDWRPGTVNLIVGADRALNDGALATLLSTAVEAKTATLLETAGVTGTTSDAVIVGGVSGAEPAGFTGSATAVGAATRACVRDAVLASLDARYDGELPGIDEADYGVVTDRQTDVSVPR